MITRIRPVRGTGVVLVALLGAIQCSGRGDPADVMPCERLSFPCTIAEVDPDVLRRSFALGEDAVERMRRDSSDAVATWLRSRPDVVEVLQSVDGVAFRLEGGRRIWLMAELVGGTSAEPAADVSPIRATLDAPRRWRPSLPTLYAQPASGGQRQGGVVGVDLDGDGKITQRDPKRALILVPDPQPYLDQALGIRDLLIRTPGYDFEDSVEVLQGPQAGADSFRIWNEYDLIHLSTMTTTVCATDDGWVNPLDVDTVTAETCALLVATGTAVDPSKLEDRTPGEAGRTPAGEDRADRPDYQTWVNSHGLEIIAVPSRLGELEWRLFASQRYFRDAYPAGVRRAVIFLNASNEWGIMSIGSVLAGAPATSTVLMWKTFRTPEESGDLALTFFERAVEGWAPFDIVENFLGGVECAGETAPVCGVSAKVDVDLRIREVVEIRPRAESGQVPPLLEDGQKLELLMDDTLAVEPTIDLSVDVYGIMPEDVAVPVRLELAGKVIAERLVSEAEDFGDVLRLHFDDVPIDPDVQDGEEHELEAVLSLPRGGVSRYSAKLTTIDRRCYWEAELDGSLSGRFSGAGVRLRVGADHSELQLDTGFSPLLEEHWAELTGVTLALGGPPALGPQPATFGTVLSSDGGQPFTVAYRWSVDITHLAHDESGQISTIGGIFDADFRGAFLRNQITRDPLSISGRFLGNLSGPHGCGSLLFRFFAPLGSGG